MFRERVGWFVSVCPLVFIYDESTKATVSAKPMAIDPIFWGIVGLPENAERPLSFRLLVESRRDARDRRLPPELVNVLGFSSRIRISVRPISQLNHHADVRWHWEKRPRASASPVPS